MTISSTLSYLQAAANGTTTQFSFSNKIFQAADLVVTLIDLLGNFYPFTSSGFNTFTNTALGLSYTVSNVDVDAGCFITFSSAPTMNWTVDMRTSIAELQSTSIKNQSGFLPELHEEFFDKATRMIQDLYRLTYTFGIHGPDIDSVPWTALPSAALRAGMGLVFNSVGQPAVAPSQAFAPTLLVNVMQYGVTMDGVTDDTSAMNSAIAAAATGSFGLFVPAGICRTTSPLLINAPVTLYGTGTSPYIGDPAGQGPGPGSWFHANHAGQAFTCQTLTDSPASGLQLTEFGIFRDQPAPPSTGTWTPNPNDYDIWIENFGTYVDDVCLLNGTNGLYFTSAASDDYAALDINRMRGQVFNDFIHIDTIYDVAKVTNCHRWSFWADNAAVHTYEEANANFAYLARCDNPQFSNNFAIACNAMFRFAQNANGTCTRFQLSNNGADSCVYGIYVDSTVTTGVLGQVENFYTLAPAGVAASNNILIAGNNSIIDFGKVELQGAQQNAIQIFGTGNTLQFAGPVRAVLFNQAAGGFAAFQCDTGNNLVFTTHPVVDASGLKYGGLGNIWSPDFRSYVPTVTSLSGAITTLGAISCSYKMEGETCTVQFDITITTNGTGAGSVNFTLPLAVAAGSSSVGIGREQVNTGYALNVNAAANSTAAACFNYNNTYPGANGARLTGTLVYPTQGL